MVSYWFLFSVQMTYLAEVMSVKCQHCLRSQLEQMELCSQDLLSGGHCGQVEPELHLFTTHCSRIIKKTVNAKVFYSILYKGLIFFLKSHACTNSVLHLSKKLRTVFPSRRYGSLVTPSTSATVLYRSSMYCGACLCPWIAGGSSIPKTSKSLLMAADRTSLDSSSPVKWFSR